MFLIMIPFLFKVKDYCKSNNIDLIYRPGRLTSLPQTADVCWFWSIKQEYKKFWNEWYLHENHEFTRNNHMKSPGFVKSSQWLSSIWTNFRTEILNRSFISCGIIEHELEQIGKVIVSWNPLHGVLRKTLGVFHYINF